MGWSRSLPSCPVVIKLEGAHCTNRLLVHTHTHTHTHRDYCLYNDTGFKICSTAKYTDSFVLSSFTFVKTNAVVGWCDGDQWLRFGHKDVRSHKINLVPTLKPLSRRQEGFLAVIFFSCIFMWEQEIWILKAVCEQATDTYHCKVIFSSCIFV